ncbi:saccharopine dehydrogenase [Nocardia altamirensis]|uniref:saccharopine dehydrogenase n=1 Tax=Nocardia altamirensis TaxID=472158 RepID=UPI0008403499|nr:saccharopine dehydrogenase [Nocardia altamirensis]
MEQKASVLILGGSGQAGSDTATMLRRWHPELPLTIAGRNLERAQQVADELGGATAVTIDLNRKDLGLPAGQQYSAVVATLWDARLNGLRYAQDHGLPYLSISSGLVDIAPEVVAGAQRATASPILVASHWAAGLVTLAALDAARAFGRIDTIKVGAILDETDAGGPAALVDLERWAEAAPTGLVRRDGVFTWVAGSDMETTVRTVDGADQPAQYIAILDVTSMALATAAPNVSFAFAIGESAGRRGGGPASVEVRIDLEGTTPAGAALTTTRTFVHAEGQRPITALGVALGVERLLGLRGEPVAPGIHTPESLLDPAYVVKQMAEIGIVFIDG